MKIYLAGPMRGYERYNFARFEDATRILESAGYEVRAPHRMDLAVGFDPEKSLDANGFSMEDTVRRDIEAIIWCQAVVLLEGWEKSTGANAERGVAIWLGRDVYTFEDFICPNPT